MGRLTLSFHRGCGAQQMPRSRCSRNVWTNRTNKYRWKKYLGDLERFVGFLGAADWERVCLTAQKSYKSEQIEQIDVDEKKDLEDLERFFRWRSTTRVGFIRLSAHQLVSAQPTEKSVPRGTPYISMYKMKTTNAGRLSGLSENIPTNAESLAEVRKTSRYNRC